MGFGRRLMLRRRFVIVLLLHINWYVLIGVFFPGSLLIGSWTMVDKLPHRDLLRQSVGKSNGARCVPCTSQETIRSTTWSSRFLERRFSCERSRDVHRLCRLARETRDGGDSVWCRKSATAEWGCVLCEDEYSHFFDG